MTRFLAVLWTTALLVLIMPFVFLALKSVYVFVFLLGAIFIGPLLYVVLFLVGFATHGKRALWKCLAPTPLALFWVGYFLWMERNGPNPNFWP
jgi:hypothetical protein